MRNMTNNSTSNMLRTRMLAVGNGDEASKPVEVERLFDRLEECERATRWRWPWLVMPTKQITRLGEARDLGCRSGSAPQRPLRLPIRAMEQANANVGGVYRTTRTIIIAARRARRCHGSAYRPGNLQAYCSDLSFACLKS